MPRREPRGPSFPTLRDISSISLVTFIIAPVVMRRLGDTAYGVWGLISRILGYSFRLDFGIRIAVARYVGRHLALDEPRN